MVTFVFDIYYGILQFTKLGLTACHILGKWNLSYAIEWLASTKSIIHPTAIN